MYSLINYISDEIYTFNGEPELQLPNTDENYGYLGSLSDSLITLRVYSNYVHWWQWACTGTAVTDRHWILELNYDGKDENRDQSVHSGERFGGICAVVEEGNDDRFDELWGLTGRVGRLRKKPFSKQLSCRHYWRWRRKCPGQRGWRQKTGWRSRGTQKSHVRKIHTISVSINPSRKILWTR